MEREGERGRGSVGRGRGVGGRGKCRRRKGSGGGVGGGGGGATSTRLLLPSALSRDLGAADGSRFQVCDLPEAEAKAVVLPEQVAASPDPTV